MNKSKFLKKSLAALLAILMVAAMIPLSAAAATVYPGNETITVTEGTLARETEGDDSSWIVTIPYNGADSTTITVKSKDAKRFFEVQEDGTLKEFEGASSAVVTVAPTQSATIVLRPADAEDETQDITYKFSVEKDATSNNTAIKTATFTYGAGPDDKVTGEVDDAAKTITFTVPWGEVPSGLLGDANSPNGPNNTNKNVAVTLVNHPLNSNGSAVTLPATQPTVAADGTCSITVTAQDNGTDIYNVKFVEEEALTGLTIGGVDAVKGTDGKWTATLTRDELTTVGGLVIDASAGKTVENIAMKKGGAPDVTSASPSPGNDILPAGNKYAAFVTEFATTANPVLDEAAYQLTIKDEDDHWAKPVDLTVKVFKSSDTTLKSFTANVNNYIETAEISGKQVNLTVNKTADKDQVAAGLFNFAFDKPMSEVKLNGNTVTLSADKKSVDTAQTPGSEDNKGLVLGTGTNILDVKAEDNTTTDRYWINVVNAKTTTDTPVVTKAVMEFDDVKYEGVVTNTTTKPRTIEFTVPAAVDKDDLNAALAEKNSNFASSAGADPAASFSWELSAHTYVNSADKPLVSSTVAAADTVKYIGSVDWANTILAKDQYESVAGSYFAADYTMTHYTAGAKDGDDYASVTEITPAVPLSIKVNVKSDGNTAGDDWTVIFKQDPAKEGHALGSTMTIKVADKEADVTEANTFKATVSNGATKGVTITDAIPYAMHAGNDTGKFANFEYTVSERAKLYVVKSDDKIYEVPADAFTTAGAHSGTLTIADLTTAKMLVVASEDQWKDWTITDSTTTYKEANDADDSNLAVTDSKVTEYPITKTLTPASAAKDIISLTADEGLVSSEVDAAAGTVTLTVPTTYVEKDKETKFNLVAELSPLAKEIKYTYGTSSETVMVDETIKNAQVKGDAENGYKLYAGANAVTGFIVKAENTTTKKFTLTVQAADLDDDNSLSGITVKDVAATEGEDGWTVELPYGTDLAELTIDDVVATVAEKADYTVAAGEEEGTFTITVKAENGQTAEYTLTVTVADEPENPFTDIGDPNDPNNWSASSIITASQNGWILGMGDGKFGPKVQMTRAQFALIIARIQAGGNAAWEEIAGDYTTDVYDDVSATNDYMNAIAYVTEEGIMSGKGAGKFDPNGTITRQEAAKVMAVASGLEEIPGNTTYSDDASIAGWAKGYVNAVTEYNIMNGMGAGFSPNVKLTREMGATILVRAFDKADEPNEPDEPTE